MTGQEKTPGGTGKASHGQRAQPPQGMRRESGKPEPSQAGAAGRAGGDRSKGAMASSRPERYLAAAAQPGDARALAGQLGQDPQVTVVRTMSEARAARGYPAVAVIETTPERAAALAWMPALRIEPDQRLGWSAPRDDQAGESADAMAAPAGELQRVVIIAEDDGGHPVEDATVCLAGQGLPALGFTGPDGRVDLAVAAETAAGPELLI